MAAQDRTTLYSYFNTGDKPTETQFANLIDSYVSLTDPSIAAATITVNVPAVGDGSGAKILKRGNAVIQLGEYSDDDTTISSDDGAFTTNATLYIAASEGSIYWNGNAVISANSARTRLSYGSPIAAVGFEQNAIGSKIGTPTKQLGFYGSAGATIPTIVGSRGANAALTSLLAFLASLGLIVDGSTP